MADRYDGVGRDLALPGSSVDVSIDGHIEADAVALCEARIGAAFVAEGNGYRVDHEQFVRKAPALGVGEDGGDTLLLVVGAQGRYR
jgi:hypothetical protein